MSDKKVAKVAKEYYCECCDYKCFNKTNYIKHLQTIKHKYLQNTDKNVLKLEIKFDCICGKSYKHRQSLYTHQSKCTFKDKEIVKQDLSHNLSHDLSQGLSQEFVLNVIKKQQDQITELTNTIKEMAPLINNTNNTINNTQNNKFNINVFLNENCKNAINMTNFIKSIKISI